MNLPGADGVTPLRAASKPAMCHSCMMIGHSKVCILSKAAIVTVVSCATVSLSNLGCSNAVIHGHGDCVRLLLRLNAVDSKPPPSKL